MRHPSKPTSSTEPAHPLEMLNRLGFGPDTVLMNDPKLFVDGRFLASLLVELQDELSEKEAGLALFQIGLLHGLRDAARLRSKHKDHGTESAPYSNDFPETTPLVMHWSDGTSTDESGRFSLRGRWPERHEAIARTSRLAISESPQCSMSAGYTTGWLSGTLDRSIIVREIECAAAGAKVCRFEARESAVWQESDAPDIHSIISHVPFEAFRKIAPSPTVQRDLNPPIESDALDTGFNRSEAVVHIWGPVMVLPFTTLDEALGTIDMLGRDSGIGEIRAVVIDLRDQPLDEGFGAAALEQILETIETWNAQSLITGVSAQSEAAISSLEISHIVLRKDLPEAIATAFQISDVQRHQL
ncbi:MAG: 4-vinyl reductase [Myxococcales bacterium]|nr:hypothetical protein [Myxococcales bacterium]HIK86086.1 hypothetical protein [Myxococcales bacterium]